MNSVQGWWKYSKTEWLKKTLKSHQNSLLLDSDTEAKKSVGVIPDIKEVSLKLVYLRHIEWKIAFWNVKISWNPNIM